MFIRLAPGSRSQKNPQHFFWHLGSISSMFYVQLLRGLIPKCKKSVKLSIFFTLLGSTRVKAAHKALVKLTPRLNFINVLWVAFACPDPKSIKKTAKLSIFYTLLGSTSVKAARKMLVKLTADSKGSHMNMCWEWPHATVWYIGRSLYLNSKLFFPKINLFLKSKVGDTS